MSNAFHQQGGGPAQSAHLPGGKGGKKHGKAVSNQDHFPGHICRYRYPGGQGYHPDGFHLWHLSDRCSVIHICNCVSHRMGPAFAGQHARLFSAREVHQKAAEIAVLNQNQ